MPAVHIAANELPEVVAPRVPTDDLRVALAAALSRIAGAPRRVVRFTRAASPYHSSFAIEILTVTLDDGSVWEVLFKDLSRAGMLDVARAVKPAFLYDPEREIRVYSHVLAGGRLGTAACFGSVVEPKAGQYWLFLEKVAGRELYQEGDLGVW